VKIPSTQAEPDPPPSPKLRRPCLFLWTRIFQVPSLAVEFLFFVGSPSGKLHSLKSPQSCSPINLWPSSIGIPPPPLFIIRMGPGGFASLISVARIAGPPQAPQEVMLFFHFFFRTSRNLAAGPAPSHCFGGYSSDSFFNQ